MKKVWIILLMFAALFVFGQNPAAKSTDFRFTETSVNMIIGEEHDFYFLPASQMYLVTFSLINQQNCVFTYININQGYIRVKAISQGYNVLYAKYNGKVAKCQITIKN